MKKNLLFLYLFFYAAFLFANDLYWEGKAVITDEYSYPKPAVLEKPVYPLATHTAYSNKFQTGDIIQLKNTTNNKEIIIEIIGTHKLGLILIALSPIAGKELELQNISEMSEEDFFNDETINCVQARRKYSVQNKKKLSQTN
ncbi:MAG: hypothetical protein ACRC5H_04485 [Treponemataceae bacterium]